MRKILTAAFADFYLFPKEYLLNLVAILGTPLGIVLSWTAIMFGSSLLMQPANTKMLLQETGRLIAHPLLGIVDEGNFLTGSKNPDFVFYPDETAALNAALDGDTGGFCVLPTDLPDTFHFRCTYTNWKTLNIVWVLLSMLQERIAQASPLNKRLDAAIASVEIEELPLDIVPAKDKPVSPLTQWVNQWLSDDPTDIAYAVLPLFIVLLIIRHMDHALGNLTYSLIEEKRRRLIDTLLTSLSATQLLSAKLLSHAILEGILQVILGLGLLGLVRTSVHTDMLASSITSLLTPYSVFWTVAFGIGGYVLYGLVFLGFAARATHPNEIRPLRLAWIIFHYSILSSGMPSTLGRSLPWFFQGFSLFPLTSFASMPYRIMVEKPPQWEVVTAYLLLLGSIYLVARILDRVVHSDVLFNYTPLKMYVWERGWLRGKTGTASNAALPADHAG